MQLFKDDIPITFEYQGKQYQGRFMPMSGMGSTLPMYDLATWQTKPKPGLYHCGSLHLLDRGWVFHSPTSIFEDMADYFGDYIQNWLG